MVIFNKTKIILRTVCFSCIWLIKQWGVGRDPDVPWVGNLLIIYYIALCSAIFGKVKNRERGYIYISTPPCSARRPFGGCFAPKPDYVRAVAEYPILYSST